MESRFTFHSKCGGVCWQKIKRDRHNDEGIPAGCVPDLATSIVKPITLRMAKQVILKYEWLGTMGKGANRAYGIFFGPYCGGVTVWAVAGYNIPAIAKTFRLTSTQTGYLCRGACVHWAPKGTNSKLIAHSLRFERKRGTVIAIAFSDSDAGEIGTVYQATNWTYIGKGTSWPQYVSPDGKIFSSNAVTLRRKRLKTTVKSVEKSMTDSGWIRQMGNAKHRYAYLLDTANKEVIDILNRLKQSYPKRASSTGIGASGSQPEGTGVTPDDALHSPSGSLTVKDQQVIIPET